jgi:hypothetical protein
MLCRASPPTSWGAYAGICVAAYNRVSSKTAGTSSTSCNLHLFSSTYT